MVVAYKLWELVNELPLLNPKHVPFILNYLVFDHVSGYSLLYGKVLYRSNSHICKLLCVDMF